MDNQNTTLDTSVSTPTDAKATSPQLSIQDLQSLAAIVDVAVRRGAFQAAEASTVGATFDRLTAFLNAVAPVSAASDNAASNTTANASTPSA
jgi:hypothetical protein